MSISLLPGKLYITNKQLYAKNTDEILDEQTVLMFIQNKKSRNPFGLKVNNLFFLHRNRILEFNFSEITNINSYFRLLELDL